MATRSEANSGRFQGYHTGTAASNVASGGFLDNASPCVLGSHHSKEVLPSYLLQQISFCAWVCIMTIVPRRRGFPLQVVDRRRFRRHVPSIRCGVERTRRPGARPLGRATPARVASVAATAVAGGPAVSSGRRAARSRSRCARPGRRVTAYDTPSNRRRRLGGDDEAMRPSRARPRTTEALREGAAKHG